MFKSLAVALLFAAATIASVSDFHSHTPHSCPRNGKNQSAHCPHQGGKLADYDSPAPDCQPGSNCGEGLDGCTCSFSCVFGENRSKLWTASNLKAYLAARF